MAVQFATAQDAEDAFYDAMEEGDAERLRRVWEDSDEIVCLLPMQSLAIGDGVHQAFEPLMAADARPDIQVRHLRWLQFGVLAFHFVEERVSVTGNPPQPPLYALNIYRKGDTGWRLLVHQNAPMPPPPGSFLPPGMAPGSTPA